MIGRTNSISTFMLLSIISHGVLIFSLMFFWEVNFPLGSEPQSNVVSVTLIGKEIEKTSAFLDFENLINPIEKSKKSISGDSKSPNDLIFPSHQKESNTQGKKPNVTKGDSLQVMEGLEVFPEVIPNYSREEKPQGKGLEIVEPLVSIENDEMESPLEVFQKVGANKKEEALRDSLQASFSVEKNLASTEGNPQEGVSEGSQWENAPEWARYQMELVRLIEKDKRYPLFAKRRNMSGVVVVGFTLGAGGKASDIEVIHSSDQEILDREALDIIRRVSPFPPFPEGLRLPRMNLSISLKFDLKKS